MNILTLCGILYSQHFIASSQSIFTTSSTTFPAGDCCQHTAHNENSTYPECIFILGGSVSPTEVYCYNATSDTLIEWDSLSSPVSKHDLSVATAMIGDDIFLHDGSSIMKYNVIDKTLEILASHSDLQNYACLVKAHNNDEYLFLANGFYSNKFFIFDINSNTFHESSNQLRVRYGPVCGATYDHETGASYMNILSGWSEYIDRINLTKLISGIENGDGYAAAQWETLSLTLSTLTDQGGTIDFGNARYIAGIGYYQYIFMVGGLDDSDGLYKKDLTSINMVTGDVVYWGEYVEPTCSAWIMFANNKLCAGSGWNGNYNLDTIACMDSPINIDITTTTVIATIATTVTTTTATTTTSTITPTATTTVSAVTTEIVTRQTVTSSTLTTDSTSSVSTSDTTESQSQTSLYVLTNITSGVNVMTTEKNDGHGNESADDEESGESVDWESIVKNGLLFVFVFGVIVVISIVCCCYICMKCKNSKNNQPAQSIHIENLQTHGTNNIHINSAGKQKFKSRSRPNRNETEMADFMSHSESKRKPKLQRQVSSNDLNVNSRSSRMANTSIISDGTTVTNVTNATGEMDFQFAATAPAVHDHPLQSRDNLISTSKRIQPPPPPPPLPPKFVDVGHGRSSQTCESYTQQKVSVHDSNFSTASILNNEKKNKKRLIQAAVSLRSIDNYNQSLSLCSNNNMRNSPTVVKSNMSCDDVNQGSQYSDHSEKSMQSIRSDKRSDIRSETLNASCSIPDLDSTTNVILEDEDEDDEKKSTLSTPSTVTSGYYGNSNNSGNSKPKLGVFRNLKFQSQKSKSSNSTTKSTKSSLSDVNSSSSKDSINDKVKDVKDKGNGRLKKSKPPPKMAISITQPKRQIQSKPPRPLRPPRPPIPPKRSTGLKLGNDLGGKATNIPPVPPVPPSFLSPLTSQVPHIRSSVSTESTIPSLPSSTNVCTNVINARNSVNSVNSVNSNASGLFRNKLTQKGYAMDNVDKLSFASVKSASTVSGLYDQIEQTSGANGHGNIDLGAANIDHASNVSASSGNSNGTTQVSHEYLHQVESDRFGKNFATRFKFGQK